MKLFYNDGALIGFCECRGKGLDGEGKFKDGFVIDDRIGKNAVTLDNLLMISCPACGNTSKHEIKDLFDDNLQMGEVATCVAV